MFFTLGYSRNVLLTINN